MATSTKRAYKPTSRAMLSRAGSVANWGGYVFVFGDRRGGQDSRRSLLSLVIRGEFMTPVRGIFAFALRVSPESEPDLGNVEIPCVGVWRASKSVFEGGIYLSDREFNLISTMASSGKLVSVHFSFQEPRYGKSLIASVSFSSDHPEEED